ncbi:hypothetical protein [Leucobacter soli]|uniref:hypothetical protein n=1 Tax=Leucobacter soli TaxID=2812850 RepID=UPI00360DA681
MKATALKGRKLKLTVSLAGATGVKPAAQTATVTVQTTGAKRSYTVKLKNGSGTVKLPKVAKFKAGKKVTVRVSLPGSKASSASTVYTVKKTVKTAKVRLK